jgi:AcrR family transcriptional regulator
MVTKKPNPRQKQTTSVTLDISVRQRIIAEARRHFFAYGFRHVTMDDLARELGMSKKTLYAHFARKADLLQAVFLDKFHSVEADLERITSNLSSDFSGALHELLTTIQEHLEEIRPSFVRDMQRDAPEMFEMVQTRRKDLIHRHFSKVMAEGRRCGIIRDDIPTELIVEIMLAAVQGIMNPKKITELELFPKEGFSAILRVILEGVITDTGRSKL